MRFTVLGMFRRFGLARGVMALLCGLHGLGGRWDCRGEDEFELPPMLYSASEPRDAVSELKRRVEADPTLLAAPDDKGFVEKMLKELGVPKESQVLVFSKTSLQRSRISPSTPRAMYFSDRCYVGWVPGGEAEVTSFDPALGATFYVVPREFFHQKPRWVRDGDCLSCHAGSKTRGVPSPLVRSVFTGSDGEPILKAGSFSINQENPLSERWGGWYVTGRHGSERHMGNALATETPSGAILDREAGANLLSLDRFFDTRSYPMPGSDIVALMVFEHQVGVQQRLLEANQNVRFAIYRYQALMRELQEPATGTLAGSALSVVNNQVEKILEEMLMVREAPLTGGGVEGDPAFVRAFQGQGTFDPSGRSLREIDGKTRLFKHRMSYMIYSPYFLGLPTPLKERFWSRLEKILGPEEAPPPFDGLVPRQRRAIREILAATHPEAPASWRKALPDGANPHNRPVSRPAL